MTAVKVSKILDETGGQLVEISFPEENSFKGMVVQEGIGSLESSFLSTCRLLPALSDTSRENSSGAVSAPKKITQLVIENGSLPLDLINNLLTCMRTNQSINCGGEVFKIVEFFDLQNISLHGYYPSELEITIRSVNAANKDLQRSITLTDLDEQPFSEIEDEIRSKDAATGYLSYLNENQAYPEESVRERISVLKTELQKPNVTDDEKNLLLEEKNTLEHSELYSLEKHFVHFAHLYLKENNFTIEDVLALGVPETIAVDALVGPEMVESRRSAETFFELLDGPKIKGDKTNTPIGKRIQQIENELENLSPGPERRLKLLGQKRRLNLVSKAEKDFKQKAGPHLRHVGATVNDLTDRGLSTDTAKEVLGLKKQGKTDATLS